MNNPEDPKSPTARKKAKVKVVNFKFKPSDPLLPQAMEILNVLIPHAPEKVKEQLVSARDMCWQIEKELVDKKNSQIR